MFDFKDMPIQDHLNGTKITNDNAIGLESIANAHAVAAYALVAMIELVMHRALSQNSPWSFTGLGTIFFFPFFFQSLIFEIFT